MSPHPGALDCLVSWPVTMAHQLSCEIRRTPYVHLQLAYPRPHLNRRAPIPGTTGQPGRDMMTPPTLTEDSDAHTFQCARHRAHRAWHGAHARTDHGLSDLPLHLPGPARRAHLNGRGRGWIRVLYGVCRARYHGARHGDTA